MPNLYKAVCRGGYTFYVVSDYLHRVAHIVSDNIFKNNIGIDEDREIDTITTITTDRTAVLVDTTDD